MSSFDLPILKQRILLDSRPTVSEFNTAIASVAAGPRAVEPATSDSSITRSYDSASSLVNADRGGPKYPSGTVHYYHSGTGIYYVAVPNVSGFGGQLGQTHDLSTSTEDPGKKGSTATTMSDIQTKTGVLLYYPPGTVHWYDTKTSVYYVAIPKTSMEKSLGCTGCGALGQDYNLETSNIDPTPRGSTPTSAKDIEDKTGIDPTPRGSTPTSAKDIEDKTGIDLTPFYKEWWFWALVGIGTVAAGALVYYKLIKE